MGGRGTFAAGNNAAFMYETVGFIDGVKVLQKITGSQKLPEESHTSNAYILLDKNGNFYQYREYGNTHYLTYEIGYHREPKIDNSRVPVFHVHEYGKDFSSRTTRAITQAEYEKYKKYFKGVAK